MTNQPSLDFWKLCKHLLVAAPAYGILVSLAYLSCYWKAFDVNVFERISPIQILLLSAYWLLPFVAVTAIGAALGLLGRRDHKQSTRRSGWNEALSLLVAVVLPLCAMVYVAPYSLPLSIMLVVALAMPKMIIDHLRHLIDFPIAVVVFLSVSFLSIACGLGWSNALRIKYGFVATTVNVSAAESAPGLDRFADTAIHTLGRVGDAEIFYVPRTETVIIIPADRIREMQILDRRMCFRCFSVAGGSVERINPLLDSWWD